MSDEDQPTPFVERRTGGRRRPKSLTEQGGHVIPSPQMSDEDQPAARPARLDKSTLVPLGSIAFLVSVMIKGAIYFTEMEGEHQHQMDMLKRSSETTQKLLGEAVRCEEMQKYILELRLANPAFQVPARSICG